MTNLSLAAQTVKDAVLATYSPNLPPNSIWALEQAGIAAAFRAAANHLTDATSSHTLYAIADELEGITYGTYRCHLKAQ